MTKGVNRAHLQNFLDQYFYLGNCIFISHKYEDLEAAKAVANCIMDYGIDVYLDDRDCELQKAVEDQDSKKIVSCIENGIKESTHILILVTENTRKSWWVPYETGYAKGVNKEIASLLLKSAEDFPDYLKIEKTLTGFNDLIQYIRTLVPYNSPTIDDRFLEPHKKALLEHIEL